MTENLRTTFRRLTGAGYLPVLFLAFAWSALAPAFPQYLAGLGAGVATVGTIVAMKGIGQVLSDVPGGLMLSAWGLKRITMVSYVLSIAANLALVWTRSLPLITGLTFTSGFFSSILITGFMARVRMTVPPQYRGRALSGAGGALRTGMLLGPVAGGVVAEHFGVPGVFVLRSLALGAGFLSFGIATVGEPADGARTVGGPQPADASVPVAHPLRRILHPFVRVAHGLHGRWYAVATVGLGILILSILRSSREIIIPLWGEDLGLSPARIGVAMGIGAAFDLMLFLPSGMVSDTYGRKVVATMCLGVFSLGLLAMLPAGTFAFYIAAASLIGIGNGFGAGINMTTGTDLAPERSVAEFLGLWRLYGDLGTAVGPIMVGALAAAFTLGPAVAATAGIGFLGAGVMAVLAPETGPRGRHATTGRASGPRPR